MSATTSGRPVLRYHGGKFLLAPWIIAHFPPHRIYVEPFGGAASVLMRKPRTYAEVYNDLDGEVVNVFKVLRDPRAAHRLRRAVSLTPYSRTEFEGSYEESANPVEQARRTIVRSYFGFGSNATCRLSHGRTGFRANALRQGTVPAIDWRNWPEAIPGFVERLRGVCIERRPALEVIAQQDSPETLHYVDPPYVHATRSAGNLHDKKHFYSHELTDADHRALAELLHQVQGMVILSGYPCDLYDRDLFPSWRRIERKALADGARVRTEVLWLNPAAADRLPAQQSLLTA